MAAMLPDRGLRAWSRCPLGSGRLSATLTSSDSEFGPGPALAEGPLQCQGNQAFVTSFVLIEGRMLRRRFCLLAFMPLWDLHLGCLQRWFLYRTGGHLNPHGRYCAPVRPRGESQLFRDGPCPACAPLLCSRLADIADIAEHSCLKPPQQVDGTRRSFVPTRLPDRGPCAA
jgi:hypothetical protein